MSIISPPTASLYKVFDFCSYKEVTTQVNEKPLANNAHLAIKATRILKLRALKIRHPINVIFTLVEYTVKSLVYSFMLSILVNQVSSIIILG